MYSELLATVQTTDDKALLESEINMLKSAMFDSKNDFSSVLATRVRKNISELMDHEINQSNMNNKDYILGLENTLKSLQVVNLTLAYEPDRQSFATIYQWFVDNVGKNIILDIYTNPNLLGGIQVSYNGKYYDGSIASKVEKISQSRSK